MNMEDLEVDVMTTTYQGYGPEGRWLKDRDSSISS